MADRAGPGGSKGQQPRQQQPAAQLPPSATLIQAEARGVLMAAPLHLERLANAEQISNTSKPGRIRAQAATDLESFRRHMQQA